MVLRRAILIGINYINTQYRLNGCINDIKASFNYIIKAFPSCTQFFVLTDEPVSLVAPSSNYGIVYGKPTAREISNTMYISMFGLKTGDSIFIHYSGHGGRLRDINGDEVSGFDSCIYPCSNGKIERIIDDDIRKIIADRVPPGITCFTLFDCCYSGSALDLRYQYMPRKDGAGNIVSTPSFTENRRQSNTRGTVIYYSACQDNQEAAEYYSTVNKTTTGAMTEAFLGMLRKYGNRINPRALLIETAQDLKNKGFPQIPQFESGLPIDMNRTFSL
jgi:metacaspase-1